MGVTDDPNDVMARTLLLVLVAELLFVAVLLVGVAMLSVPTAMILGGLLGVLACERWNMPARKART